MRNIADILGTSVGLATGDVHDRVIGTGKSGPRGIESVLEYNGLFMNVREWVDTYLVTTIGGIDDADIRRRIRRSVLVHELLHAVISSAVGSDEVRQAARSEARNVEECLAVWLELEAARDCPAMRDLINKYVSAGTYPEWPYAGTGALESNFLTGGRHAVHLFVSQLIDNPTGVQEKFDKLVRQASADREISQP